MSLESNRETEVNILKVLLDFEPKNQNEIVAAIGKNKKNSTNRVKISRSIPDLTNYLERRRNRLDESGKRWVLKKEKEILKQIAIKYPELMIDLQNSYSVIEIIRDSVLGKERVDELTHPLELSDNMFYAEMVEWFRLSPSFFEYCLKNDYENIMNHWRDFSLLTDGGVAYSERKIRFKGESDNPLEQDFYGIMERVFEHCVRSDVLNEQSNPEAVEDIRQKKKERLEASKAFTDFQIEEHDRKVLTKISWQTFDETHSPIMEKNSNKTHLSFGQMEEDGKLSLMSNNEKKEYFKKLGVPITEKLAKKYNIMG